VERTISWLTPSVEAFALAGLREGGELVGIDSVGL
jgi:hypothetical protein